MSVVAECFTQVAAIMLHWLGIAKRIHHPPPDLGRSVSCLLHSSAAAPPFDWLPLHSVRTALDVSRLPFEGVPVGTPLCIYHI